jgi:hypothetical protein
MAEITKAKICVGNNSIELEGNENFVSKYLGHFEKFINSSSETKESFTPSDKSINHITPKQNIQTVVKGDKKIKRNVKSIEPEEFNISTSGDIPSLEDFLKQKSPGKAAGNIIPVIAYYLQVLKKSPYFTEGNIDFAYKALSIPERPVHIRQIIINKKNENLWFEESEDGLSWKLTRTGEIYVEEKLPTKKG